MILSKFSKRELRLLIGTIVIVGSTVSYVFITEPLMRNFHRLNRQIETGRLKLERSYKLLKRQDAIKGEYEKYIALVKPSPSDEEEIASMLKAIESIASSNKISIRNIRPQPVKDRRFYSELIFELVAESDLSHLVKFIYDLQVSGNLLKVRRLTLTASSSKGAGLKAVMEITKPSTSDLLM